MNDAERDAWLREALRHAPDSDALPPSGISEAILLKARAAARGTAPPRRRPGSGDAHETPLTALWNWLARPPVAAGFASVMAATLVGLMWWDRPMDEAMPRPPALASDRAPAAPLQSSTSPATAETPARASPSPAPAAPPALMTDATPAAPNARPMREAANNAVADDGNVRRRQRSAPDQAGAADAKRAEPADAPAPHSGDLLAKEQALPIEKKNEAPAPFPPTEAQREAPSPRKSLDAAAPNEARKKDVEAGRSRAADEAERAVPPATDRLVAAPPAVRPPPVGATEPAPAPFSNESQRRRSEGQLRADASAGVAAPARVLAAIAAEPGRWLRQTAGGDTVALDAGWRAWLAELDAAAAGRWQPLGAAAPFAEGAATRDGSTTLRLVSAGRVAAIVRIDGSTVQVDTAPGTGADRWQASLGPAGAEQLRSTARRLSP